MHSKYIKLEAEDFKTFSGDFDLIVWIAILRRYTEQTKPDQYGFYRINHRTIEETYMISYGKFRRLNQKLEYIGIISIDKVKRGGSTWMGFRFVQ